LGDFLTSFAVVVLLLELLLLLLLLLLLPAAAARATARASAIRSRDDAEPRKKARLGRRDMNGSERTLFSVGGGMWMVYVGKKVDWVGMSCLFE